MTTNYIFIIFSTPNQMTISLILSTNVCFTYVDVVHVFIGKQFSLQTMFCIFLFIYYTEQEVDCKKNM